jgi:putative restriction endonuclease
LVLPALARLSVTGSSELAWSGAEVRLAALIKESRPASRTSRAQSAAYPFTRLRSDGIWRLDHNVPMDLITPLAEHHVVGRFEPSLESRLLADPTLIPACARGLIDSHFPETVAADVLMAVGLDPDTVLRAADLLPDPAAVANARRRGPGWRSAVLQAWDRQCAFCGYDGQVGGATVGVEAAHARWFLLRRPRTAAWRCAFCTTSSSTSAR